MKKNTLYTVNPWNRNLFYSGGGVNSTIPNYVSGLDFSTNYGDVGQRFNAIVNSGNNGLGNWKNVGVSGTKTNGGSGINWGTVKQGAQIGASALLNSDMGDRALDEFDPIWHLAGQNHSATGDSLSSAGKGIFKAGVSSANPWLMLAGAGAKILGGGINILAGYGIQNEQAVKNNVGNLKNVKVGGDLDDIQRQFANISLSGIGLGKVTNGLLNNKGTRKAKDLTSQQEDALAFANNSFENAIKNAQQDQTNNLLRNYAALGGYIGIPAGIQTGSLGIMQQDKYIDAINNRSNAIAKVNTVSPSSSYTSLTANRFSDGGGIHIKPSHRGLFTEKANRAGMGVQAYASHVLANKEDYPSSTVKQANFAKNAAGWKHDAGGNLEMGFMDSFSQDPIAAAMQYTQGLDAMEAAQEAQAEQAAQEAAYNDMQKRLAKTETQNQGLQALLDSQALSLKTLEDRQAAAQEWGNDWKSRMVEKAETYKGNANDTAVMARMRKSLQERGVTKRAHQDAIIANMMVESKGNPNARNANSSARGLMQWLSDRHPSKWDWDSQVDHIVNTYNKYGENNWLDKKAHKKFMDTDDSLTAARLFRQYWERPEPETYKATDKYINQMYGLDKKAFGGELGTNGTDFTNGLLEINSGGSHEENPFEGVQMGLDPNGVPNLVEEGETVYNNYVFSKRMFVPEFMKKELGLTSGKKDITFADASKKIAEESKERPNDPISQAGLDAGLAKLAQVQETERSRMQAEEANAEMEAINETNMAACGGKLNKFDGGGKKINPYAYSESWDGFKYFDPSTQQYNADYMNFVNSINQDWINRIMSGQYGSMDRYLARNKGVTPSIEQVQALATDKKYSDMHKAMAAAYDEYLKGIDPVTGEATLPEVVVTASNRNADNYPQTYWGPGANNTSFWTAAQQAGYTGLPEVDWRGNAGAKAPIYVPESVTAESAGVQAPMEISSVLEERKGDTEDPMNARTGKENNEGYTVYPTWMRYAPVVGSGIMTLTDALGLTNKPDYTYADKIEAAAERAGYAPNIRPDYIGDYMRYTPLDRLFYANQLQANARATDRALMNTSSGNSGTARAAMIANGYNTNNNLGNLYRQAEEYNRAQYERTKEFNRGTNMFNAQQGLEAAMANARYRQAAAHASLSGLAQAAAIRDAIDQRVGAAKSANITNLLQGLSNIGRENFAMNQINSDRSRRYKGRLNGTSYYSAFGGEIEKFQKNKRNRRK